MINVDHPLAPSLVEYAPQHLLAMLDPASAQVMPVDMQQVESVIGEPLGVALREAGFGAAEVFAPYGCSVAFYRTTAYELP